METRILNDVAVHGALIMSKNETGFPENPRVGTLVIKDNTLYAYIQIGDLETWYPYGNRTSSYIHVQGLPAQTWYIEHNLGTSDIWYQVQDSNGEIVQARATPIDQNNLEVYFTTPITGKVIIVAPTSVDVPEVKATSIQAGGGYVIIDNTGIRVDGDYVLTSGNIEFYAEQAIGAETTARVNADLTLQANIDAEVTARSAADTTLQANINAEITSRTNADTTLQNNINAEATSRANAVATVQASVDAEVTARANADTTLQNAINVEVTARTTAVAEETTARANADTTLQNALNAEITARVNADSTLQANITAVDNKVNALGSAFNYVGTVNGGTQESPYDLAILDASGKNSGDYYKVGQTGYFVVGAGAAFYANANDGLVWNNVGSVDLIDNTNSTVSGTSNFVAVTGSVDTGYVVDIDNVFKTRMSSVESNLSAEITSRTSADTTLQNAINAEVTARVNAVATVQANVEAEATARSTADVALQNAIDAEVTARSNAVTTVQNAVNAEVTARTEADTTLQNAIDAEATLRINADSTLQANINVEVTARTNAVATVQSSLSAEATTRANADTTLQANIDAEVTTRANAINSEATARANADVTLQNAIDAEVTARIASDSTLQSSISAEVTARTNADITLQNNIDAEATARTNADTTLQNAINAEVTARADADTTLQNVINAEVTARASAVNAEATARANADITLQANIDAEVTARANAVSTLQSSINELDGLVESLGNAFNYIGTVNGGATAETALDMSTLASGQKDAGDYFKVSQAGYFKASSAGTPFYANSGDGLVWNTASGIDIIDNTNSSVSGTTNFVSVTGSADTGYVVDIDNAFKTRVTNAEADILAEKTARTNADTTLQSNINAEATARADADTTLQNAINTEVTARANADTTLQANIDAEITARTNADATLQSNINAKQDAATAITTSNIGSQSVSYATTAGNGGVTSVNGLTGAVTITTGATVADDTTTDGTRYVVWEDVTSGNSTSIGVSSTKLTFNPSTGALAATKFVGDGSELTGVASAKVGAIYEGDAVIATSYTLTAGKNGMSPGPISLASGVVITVPSGSVWTVV